MIRSIKEQPDISHQVSGCTRLLQHCYMHQQSMALAVPSKPVIDLGCVSLKPQTIAVPRYLYPRSTVTILRERKIWWQASSFGNRKRASSFMTWAYRKIWHPN